MTFDELLIIKNSPFQLHFVFACDTKGEFQISSRVTYKALFHVTITNYLQLIKTYIGQFSMEHDQMYFSLPVKKVKLTTDDSVFSRLPWCKMNVVSAHP